MALSIRMPPANTTCDVYRNNNGPPAAPDVPGVSIHMSPRFRNIKVATGGGFVYDHIVSLPLTTDVRDNWPVGTNGDYLYLPNQNGLPYLVQFVERVRLRGADDYLRAYVIVQAPTWPATDL
jgi:hypothetical protein